MTARCKWLGITIVILALVVVVCYLYRQQHCTSRIQSSSTSSVQYSCPMHPFVIKDQPGACPICGMELVRKRTGTADTRDLNLKEHVYLSPTQQVMANVDVVNVMYKPLFKIINAAGAIAYDQTCQGKVSAWVAGRIERLHADTVGAQVTRGKPVAELSSPELLAAEEEYLTRYRLNGNDRNGVDPDSSLGKAHMRLMQLGFAETQFRELEETGKPNIRVLLFPPLNGIITAKEVQIGHYVKAGDSLFSVADLTRLWAELDVFEDEFSFLRIGQQVNLVTRAYPGREFSGRISFIYPYLDPKTRTVRIRVSVPNPHLLLKPELLVQATIQVPLGTGLALPAEAVMTTGNRSLVWVQATSGVFVPREVKTGVRYRNDIQILSGLQKDDVVAGSGAYLIDSEAQLKSVDGGNYRAVGVPGSAVLPSRSSARHPGKKPASAAHELDMGDMTMEEPPAGSGVRKRR